MKTTAQRLSEVYCRPTNEREWNMLPDRNLWCRNENAVFGLIDFEKQKVKGKTEIPAQHFIDLIEDNIVAWRLVEDAIERGGTKETARIIYVNQYHIISVKKDMAVELNGRPTNLKTYSDLLTLICLLK